MLYFVNTTARRHGVTEISEEYLSFLSHATEVRHHFHLLSQMLF